jgi:septal ring factor EnvC (AmiA/AmiB activator)
MTRILILVLAVFAAAAPAMAQDIRGLEVCTAEKAMERRTSCLQSNVEFLQQALAQHKRETQSRLDAASREVAAQKALLAALRSAMAKLDREVAELKKPKPAKK